jgi:hypothetical protein
VISDNWRRNAMACSKKKVNFSAPHATILGDEASASATKRVPEKERITHGSFKKKSDRRAGFVL